MSSDKETKEVIDLTNGGLYFTAERSTADRNALTPTLHLRQEQYREFHKKKKGRHFLFVAVRLFLRRLRWVNYLKKLGTEAEISVSFGKRHNRGIVGECLRCDVKPRRQTSLYSLVHMWAIRSQTRLLYANSLSYLVGENRRREFSDDRWESMRL